MIFDKETGEILENGGYSDHNKVKYLKPFILDGVNNKEVFLERVNDTVGRRKFRLWVSPLLPDLIVDKELSIAALGVFCYLATNIGYGTTVYVSIREVVEGSGYVRQTVYKALEELENGGYLRKTDNKLSLKEDRMYTMNPLYFYKGYYPHRENALKSWVMGD